MSFDSKIPSLAKIHRILLSKLCDEDFSKRRKILFFTFLVVVLALICRVLFQIKYLGFWASGLIFNISECYYCFMITSFVLMVLYFILALTHECFLPPFHSLWFFLCSSSLAPGKEGPSQEISLLHSWCTNASFFYFIYLSEFTTLCSLILFFSVAFFF